jgi:carbon storage regulator
MLVLTRKLMEKLFIGDDICVTVVRLEGGQVRLGIDAPRDVSVVRAELVPERQAGTARGGHRQGQGHGHHAADPPAGSGPAPGNRPEGPVRSPRASAHGTGNRRRGPSR